MHMKSLLSAGLTALTLGLAATTAQAGPVTGLTAAVAQDADRGGSVENVNWYGGYGYRPYYGYRYKPFYKPFYGRGFYGRGFYGRGYYGRGFYGRGFYGRYGYRYW